MPALPIEGYDTSREDGVTRIRPVYAAPLPVEAVSSQGQGLIPQETPALPVELPVERSGGILADVDRALSGAVRAPFDALDERLFGKSGKKGTYREAIQKFFKTGPSDEVKTGVNRLLGTGGEERYKTWPEKLVVDAITAPGNVLKSETPVTTEELIKPALDVSNLAGTGGLAGVGREAGMALGSGPIPKKLYRGIVENQQASGENGLGTFHLGKGTYSSADKNFAKMYSTNGKIVELNPAEFYPSNPLVLTGAGGAQSLLHDFIFKNTKYKNIREFNKDYPDPADFIRTLGYDGVHAGDEIVKFPTLRSDNQPSVGIGAGSGAGVALGSGPVKQVAKNLTDDFKNWFKDSKVVDADGNPLVVYHGTAADFKTFDNKKTGKHDNGLWGRGHYLTSSPETASSYALRQGDGARIIPAYASINNPLILKTGKDLITRLPDGTNTRDLVGPNLNGAKIKEIATSAGNDGVIQLKPDGTIGDIVVFNPEQIKSSIGNNGKFNPLDPNILRSDNQASLGIGAVSKSEKPFYSALERSLGSINQNKASGEQWLGMLANKGGVKPDELQWSGISEFLAGKPSVTKAELDNFLKNNPFGVQEVVKGADVPTKYHDYQLPGGENYREVLMTLPDKQKRLYGWEYFDPKTQQSKQFKTEAEAKAAAPEGAVVNQKEVAELNPSYKSSHWDEPNILAHMRMNDRTIDGKKSLHLEEIQSDWHQQGRDKGYGNKAKNELDSLMSKLKTEYGDGWAANAPAETVAKVGELQKQARVPGVPDAPFKKTWHELALKRAIREAAEKSYQSEVSNWNALVDKSPERAAHLLSHEIPNLKIVCQ